METTPPAVIGVVLASVCGTKPSELQRIAKGGLNEAYRVSLADQRTVIVRVARRGEPWFSGEAAAIERARSAGVPGPCVLGVEHVGHDGELLSCSVLEDLPGRPLDELAPELTRRSLERLVAESGELLARLHQLAGDGPPRHRPTTPADDVIERAIDAADALRPGGGELVRRGVDLINAATGATTGGDRLVHGDWLPKHLLVEDGAITGVIDWEFAGAGCAAYDLAHWQVSAGEGLDDLIGVLARGYGTTDEVLVPAFAIGQAIEKLGWRNPATPYGQRRCLDVIAAHVA